LCKETGEELAEDDTRLRLIVRDVACVLDELGHIDFVKGKATDFGFELPMC